MKNIKNIIPNKELNTKKAIEFLEEGYKLNKGPWREHSYYVAEAAKKISSNISHLDSKKAYRLGLLHDIGRRYGFSHIKHILDGYNFLSEKGHVEEARICLTHSFPIKVVTSYSGKLDCSKEELNFIQSFLDGADYNDYDRLIQLCDAISSKDGYCIIEKRLIDVAIRNGINNYSIEKWKSFIDLKEYFDKTTGTNIYIIY